MVQRSSGRGRDEGIGEILEEVGEEAAEIRAGLWQRLRQACDFIGDMTGIGPLFDALSAKVQGWFAGSGEVAFTVALIALSAKMAKADGVVSAEEVEMFRRVVEIPPGEEKAVERLFDLARRDVAGFESYASRIATIARGDAVFLGDVLTGLFHIAAADSYVHEDELAFLERVGEIFGFDRAAFDRLAGGFVRRRGPDPYAQLGVSRDADDAAVKAAWRRAVAECHPDRHFAHGLPREAMAILNDRMAAVNGAWERIKAERGLT